MTVKKSDCANYPKTKSINSFLIRGLIHKNRTLSERINTGLAKNECWQVLVRAYKFGETFGEAGAGARGWRGGATKGEEARGWWVFVCMPPRTDPCFFFVGQGVSAGRKKNTSDQIGFLLRVREAELPPKPRLKESGSARLHTPEGA